MSGDAEASPAPEGALLTDALTVRYQGTPEPAIRDVTLAVKAGEGLVVTGPEGCGKSTVVRALVGLAPITGGSVEVLGGTPVDPAIRRRVGYCPEGRPFPRTMRPTEAVELVAALRCADGAAARAALEEAGLSPGERRPVGALEIEDVRRLSLACALVGAPEVLVLDDPWEFPETVAALRAAMQRGAAVLVATPDPGGYPALLGATLTLDEGAGE